MLDAETAIAHAEAAIAELRDALGKKQDMDGLIRQRAAGAAGRLEMRMPEKDEKDD